MYPTLDTHCTRGLKCFLFCFNKHFFHNATHSYRTHSRDIYVQDKSCLWGFYFVLGRNFKESQFVREKSVASVLARARSMNGSVVGAADSGSSPSYLHGAYLVCRTSTRTTQSRRRLAARILCYSEHALLKEPAAAGAVYWRCNCCLHCQYCDILMQCSPRHFSSDPTCAPLIPPPHPHLISSPRKVCPSPPVINGKQSNSRI